MNQLYQPNLTSSSQNENMRFKMIRRLSLSQQSLKQLTPISKTQTPSIKIDQAKIMAQTLSRMNYGKFDGISKKQPLDEKIEWDQNKDAHIELTELRTKCDDILKKNQQTEMEIDFIKKDLMYYKQQEIKYQESRQQSDQNKKYLIMSQQERNYRLEDICHTKRVYLNMRNRLRQDNIFLKKDVNLLYTTLDSQNANIKIMENEEKKNKTKLFITKNNLQKTTENIQEINYEREKHIQMINDDLIENKNQQDKKEQRKQQLCKLQLQAVDEKVHKEIEFQKLYNANKFLQHFLQKKIDRERQKYKQLEYTLQKIKTQTGISDAQQIFHKYKSREQEYESLLERIQKLEQKKQQLIQRNQDLNLSIDEQKMNINLADINLQNPVQSMNPQLQKRLEFMTQRTQRSEIQEIILKKYFNGVFKRLKLNDVHTQNIEQVQNDIVQIIKTIYKRIDFLIKNFDNENNHFSAEVPIKENVQKNFKKKVQKVQMFNNITKIKKLQAPLIEQKKKQIIEMKEQNDNEQTDVSEQGEMNYIKEQQFRLKLQKQDSIKKKDDEKKKEIKK